MWLIIIYRPNPIYQNPRSAIPKRAYNIPGHQEMKRARRAYSVIAQVLEDRVARGGTVESIRNASEEAPTG
jgi:hypothetical protein